MLGSYDQTIGLYRDGDLGVSTQLTPDLLATAYLRLKAERQIETVYYQKVPTILEYLSGMTRPETICLGAFRKVGDNEKVKQTAEFAGMAWVYDTIELGDSHMKRADVSFAFFRHCATPQEKVTCGQLMVEAFFSTFNIDVLVGTTPVDNKLALKYSQQVGFGLHGPIPSFLSWEAGLSSAVISVLTKTDWQATRKRDEVMSPDKLTEVA